MFEIDLSLTADQIPVCLHDWNENYTQAFGGEPPAAIPTLQEFLRVNGAASRYTHCTTWTLLEWLQTHPEAKVITDNKDDNITILQFIKDHFPDFAERVIPQIYQPEEYQIVHDMGYRTIIWTLYRYCGSNEEVLAQAKEMELFAITMSTDRANSGLALELDKLSMPSYVHTVNNLEEAKGYFRMGVNSLYTDFITESTFKTLE